MEKKQKKKQTFIARPNPILEPKCSTSLYMTTVVKRETMASASLRYAGGQKRRYRSRSIAIRYAKSCKEPRVFVGYLRYIYAIGFVVFCCVHSQYITYN